jgi:hypothetical protein
MRIQHWQDVASLKVPCRSRAPSSGPDAYFVAQFSAGYTTNMCGLDLRQAPPNHHLIGKLSPKRWNGISVTEQTAVAWPLRASNEASYLAQQSDSYVTKIAHAS